MDSLLPRETSACPILADRRAPLVLVTEAGPNAWRGPRTRRFPGGRRTHRGKEMGIYYEMDLHFMNSRWDNQFFYLNKKELPCLCKDAWNYKRPKARCKWKHQLPISQAIVRC